MDQKKMNGDEFRDKLVKYFLNRSENQKILLPPVLSRKISTSHVNDHNSRFNKSFHNKHTSKEGTKGKKLTQLSIGVGVNLHFANLKSWLKTTNFNFGRWGDFSFLGEGGKLSL